jgi:uncharacterized membrane protein YsdA (DUF1294 family)
MINIWQKPKDDIPEKTLLSFVLIEERLDRLAMLTFRHKTAKNYMEVFLIVILQMAYHHIMDY